MKSFTWLLSTLLLAQPVWGASTLTIPVAADAYIQSTYPTVNRGTTTFMMVQNSPAKDGLLMFKVSGVGTQSISSVKLRLVSNGAGSSGGQVYSAAHSSWTETGVTYNNAPAVSSGVLAQQGAVVRGQVVDLNVTAAVRGDGSYSFRLKNSAAEANTYDYYSREAGSAYAPKLIITLGSTSPTPTPSPTPSATPVPTATPVATATPIPTATPVSAGSCLDQSGPVVALYGAQSTDFFKTSLAASTKVDLRGASWYSQILVPARIGGGNNICASGGKIQGSWNPMTTSWETYHDTYAFQIYGNDMIAENLRIDNYGDAFHIRMLSSVGNNFTIRRAHVTNNHDDCVENDGMKGGRIVDSLFDGCYSFYSSRSTSGIVNDGSQRVVEIKNNLVRMQPFPTYYGGSTTDPAQYKNNGLWKIDEFNIAPKLAIHNNIFRIDKDSHGWIPLIPDARSISSCSNNTIVWLGSGPFPENVPSCFKVTTDKSVWDNAVLEYKRVNGSN